MGCSSRCSVGGAVLLVGTASLLSNVATAWRGQVFRGGGYGALTGWAERAIGRTVPGALSGELGIVVVG